MIMHITGILVPRLPLEHFLLPEELDQIEASEFYCLYFGVQGIGQCLNCLALDIIMPNVCGLRLLLLLE